MTSKPWSQASALIRQWSRILPVAVLVALTGCGTADYTDKTLASTPAPQVYRLGAGDRIAVTVFGEKDISGEFDVDETGAVALPLVGAVNVKNKTPREVETGLEQQLTRGKLINSPKVTVAVVKNRPIYILGEVQRPGAYPYYSGITILNAVALAGGYTYRAQNKRINVVRADEAQPESQPQPQRAREDSYLEPGDIIVVPERWF